jgi:hypothetical protein
MRLRLFLVLVFVVLIVIPVLAASYPTSIWPAPTRNTGDVVQPNFFNDSYGEIVAVETGLLNGFQHNLKFLTDNQYDIGATTANRPRNVNIAGALQVAGTVTFNVASSPAGGWLNLTDLSTANATTGGTPGLGIHIGLSVPPYTNPANTDTVGAYVEVKENATFPRIWAINPLVNLTDQTVSNYFATAAEIDFNNASGSAISTIGLNNSAVSIVSGGANTAGAALQFFASNAASNAFKYGIIMSYPDVTMGMQIGPNASHSWSNAPAAMPMLLGQFVNGNDTVQISRNTDSTPNGTLLRLVNANATTTLWQVDASGTTTLGPSSTPLKNVYHGSASLTYTSIAGGAVQDQTMTVTGAIVSGGTVACSPEATPGSFVWSGWISAANTVSVRLANPGTVAATPIAVTWDCMVTQF